MAKDPTNSGKSSWKDDEELREALRKGDDSAWNYAYKLTWPFISGYVTAQGGSYDDAKEVHQQAMLVVYDKRQELYVSPKTYAYTVAQRTWWKMNGDRKKNTSFKPDSVYNGEGDEDNDPLDGLDFIGLDGVESSFDPSGLPLVEEVFDYIKNMGNPCRDLILGHHIGKKSYEETAQETNQKPGTVRVQAKRCLDKVRQHFLNRFKNQ